jgi:hypothetical protein
MYGIRVIKEKNNALINYINFYIYIHTHIEYTLT